MTGVAEKLVEARALVERGWTQGWFAKNAKGRMVSARPSGRSATCFCAIGALIRVTGKDEYHIEATPEFRALWSATGQRYIDDWNDDPKRTQAEVLAAFDKAIELARGGIGL